MTSIPESTDPLNESVPGKLNPYAPIDSADLTPIPTATSLTNEIDAKRLARSTFYFVCISGGLFGVSCVAVAISYDAFVSGFAILTSLDDLIVPIIFAAFIGMSFAATGGAFVVPVVYSATKASGAFRSGCWTGSQVRLFGATCGFITGWACLTVLGLLAEVAFEGILFGLIPAIFGAVATTLMLHRTAKKADRQFRAQQDDASAKHVSVNPLQM